MITYWIDNKNHSWQQLVNAVFNCGQKMRAKTLAENFGATLPSKLTIVGVYITVIIIIGHNYFFEGFMIILQILPPFAKIKT